MQPLQLDFKPSNTLTLMICATGIGTCIILILLPFMVQIKLLMITVVIATSIYHLMRYARLMLPWTYVSLCVDPKQAVTLIQKNGKVVNVNICHDTVVMPSLTIINCQYKAGSRLKKLLPIHVLILSDMVCPEAYRQLRVFLRWGISTRD